MLVLGPSGTVVGTVTDAADQQGLAGAQLEIGGRRGTSAAGGGFRIELVPPGSDTLHVGLSGYEPLERIILVRAGIVDTADVALTRIPVKSRLHGRVTNSLSQAVPGAACRAAGLEVLTDANGDYDFPEVPRGRQVLIVRRDAYVTQRDTLEIAEPDVVHDVRLDAAVPDQPQGTVTATKTGGLGIRVAWAPAGDRPTIVAYDLYVIDNDGPPQPVPGRQYGRNGGAIDFTGAEHHRYRFAVTATNFEGESGFLSDDSRVVVLTAPSSLARIPAGAFVMGNYPDGFGSETHPGNPVFAGAFGIETQEVTNRQFLAFLLEALDRQQCEVTAVDVRADGNVLLDVRREPDRSRLGRGRLLRRDRSRGPSRHGRELVRGRRLRPVDRPPASPRSRVGSDGAEHERRQRSLPRNRDRSRVSVPMGQSAAGRATRELRQPLRLAARGAFVSRRRGRAGRRSRLRPGRQRRGVVRRLALRVRQPASAAVERDAPGRARGALRERQPVCGARATRR